MSRITTLIPAYKPDYLGEMFLGLRRQSFRDFRVILSDDSPGGVITDMLRDGRFGPLAAELNLSINTVSNHLKRVYAKLEVRSRAELSWRLQYLDLDDPPPDVAS